MTVSEWIWEYLADIGVTHVFYLAGGGSMHLVDALAQQDRITPVACLHEQAAGVAAEAIAQYSGGLGVVLVTSGPGATNVITAVASAWIDSTPLLIISGQCATHQMMKPGQRQGGPQEVDIVSIVKPITKWAVTLRPTLPAYMQAYIQNTAYTALKNPRGPVWLDVPLNIQSSII